MTHVTNPVPAGSLSGSSSAPSKPVPGMAPVVGTSTKTSISGSGIVYTCDSTVTSNAYSPTGPGGTTMCSFLQGTIAGIYNSTFTNANAAIYIQFGITGLGSSIHEYYTLLYATYRTALIATASTDTVDVDAIASLPATEPSIWDSGAGPVAGTDAMLNTIGIAGITAGLTSTLGECTLGTAGCYNGVITVSFPSNLPAGQSYWFRGLSGGAQGVNAYDIFTVIEHETDEILGTASCIGTTTGSLVDNCASGTGESAVDLFRYQSAGTRVFSSVTPGAYFSYNGGTTNVAVYNTLANGDDYADWVTNCAHVQDATGCLGKSFDITNDGGVELDVLDAVGFNLNTAGPPVAVSVSPASGSGLGPQTFVYTFSDPLGATDIDYTETLISTGSSASACLVEYVRASNGLYLLNNAGTGYTGPSTPGTGTSLSNSQCTLNVGSSSVTPSGNNLVENLNITFNSSFAGTKSNFGYVVTDEGLLSAFTNLGTWTVSSGTAPTATSVTPSSGSGVGPESFIYTFTDANGPTDINYTETMIGTGSSVSACLVYYVRASQSLYLLNDTGTAFTGPITVGQSAAIANSQCSLNALATSVTVLDNSLSLNLNLTFKPAFAGAKSNYGYVVNNEGQASAFTLLGSWTVTGAGATLTVNSVTPNSGTGLGPEVFDFSFTDGNGYFDVSYVYGMFSGTGSGAGACLVVYYTPLNTIYLYNDDATALLGPLTPGVAGTVSNSQCSVNGAASGGSGSGNTLTFSADITFAPGFTGSKTIYGLVASKGGSASSFLNIGTWTP
jgi:hypothetical protein